MTGRPLALVAALLLAVPAGAQFGGDDPPVGEEELLEGPNPEVLRYPEIEGWRPALDRPLPNNGVVFLESRFALSATVQMGGEEVPVELAPLVPGCVHCVYAVELPEILGQPVLHVLGPRDAHSFSWSIVPEQDDAAPVIDGGLVVAVEQTVTTETTGERHVASRLRVATPPPRRGDDALAWLASAGPEEEALEPAAAELYRQDCNPCFVEVPVSVPPGEVACVRVQAVDHAGNRSEAKDPTCVEIPQPSGGLGCAGSGPGSAPATSLGALLALGLALCARRGLARALFPL